MLPRRTLEDRFWSNVSKAGEDDCWLWNAARDRYGYGVFGVDRKAAFAHRVAWKISNGYEPRGLCVLHNCDNPRCVNPRHLSVGSQADNLRDMRNKGRDKPPPAISLHGTLNGSAKLSDAEVAEIRSSAGVIPQRTLAKKYGISPAQVCRIQTGKRRARAAS
jgi:hypothetical protein